MDLGAIVLILGLPTVLFFTHGVFDEYDYWAGTVSLVVFALGEVILFAWVFGVKRGMNEINSGGDIRVPFIYKYIIKWVTPLLLLFVFLGAFITPKNNDWKGAFSNGWQLDNGSIIKKITNSGIKEQIDAARAGGDLATVATLEENLMFINLSRIILLLVFFGIAFLVYKAYRKRKKEGRIT
jgi:hypothetical protein